MNKILSYIAIFLAVVCYILFERYSNVKKELLFNEGQKNALYSNVQYLEGEIEKRNRAEMEASDRREQLQRASEHSTDDCWGKRIDIADPVLMQLHKD